MAEWWLMHWGPSWLPPEVRTVWGWKAASAIFFAGLAGMVTALAAYEGWCGRSRGLVRVGLASGLVGVLLALALFVADLGVPARFYLVVTLGWTGRLGSSWMPWGALFLTALALAGLAGLRGRDLASRGGRAIALAAMGLGVLSTVYSGFELGATSIALWNLYLPLVFLATSFSAGAAYLALVAAVVVRDPAERTSAARHLGALAIAGTVAEAGIIILFLYAAASDGRSLPAVRALFGFPLALYFWSGAVLAAGTVALLLPVVARGSGTAVPSGLLVGAFAAAGGGSFLLRLVLMVAGYAAFSPVSPFGSHTIQWP